MTTASLSSEVVEIASECLAHAIGATPFFGHLDYIFAADPFSDFGPNSRADGIVTTESTATSLPAALPLFATGLGALGLLGWRRKRQAAPAA
jgi:hypothetical protein